MNIYNPAMMIPGICTWSLSRFCGSEVLLDSLLYTRLNIRPCLLESSVQLSNSWYFITMALRPITITSDTLQAHSLSVRVLSNRDSHFPQWNNNFQLLHIDISMHEYTAESLNPDFTPGRPRQAKTSWHLEDKTISLLF